MTGYRLTAFRVILTGALCFLVLLACSPVDDRGGSNDQIATAAIQTAYAQITQTAEMKAAISTATPMPTSTATLDQPTNPPLEVQATETPVIEITETPIADPDDSDFCNRFSVIGEISTANGSELLSNETFTKIWRLRNLGTCAWTGEYSLVFVDGDPMASFTEVALNSNVAPGEVIDLSLKLKAPENTGHYWAKWMIRDIQGNTFGPVEDPEGVLRIDLTVIERSFKQYPQIKFSFFYDYCSADWISSEGVSLCSAPGNEYQYGSVYRELQPLLEGVNEENEPALVMIPADGEDGMISGIYPPYTVSTEDFFFAWVGCLEGNLLCDVTFEVAYIDENGDMYNLGSWQQKYDGEYEKAYVSLKPLVGETIRLVLIVRNNGMSLEDKAFWLVPSIRR